MERYSVSPYPNTSIKCIKLHNIVNTKNASRTQAELEDKYFVKWNVYILVHLLYLLSKPLHSHLFEDEIGMVAILVWVTAL